MTGDGTESLSRRTLLQAAAGGALAGAAGAANAQDGNETSTGTPTGTATGDGGGGGSGGSATWTIEMTDGNKFVPDSKKVRPGDTVVWKNVGSSAHSVTAYGDKIPDGADYWASGGFDSEDAARNGWPEGSVEGGESYEHTFETKGTHEYFCIPHEQIGMKGTVEVTPDAPTPTASPTPAEPALPSAAKAVGVAAAAAMASTLGLAYAFVKYGGSRRSEE